MKKQKPRLVIATDSFLPRWDGVARFLSTIIPSLEKHFNIVVIAPAFGPHEQNSYHLVQIPVLKGKFADIQFAQLRYGIIKKEIRKADVVFTQTIGPIGGLAILAAKRLRKPLVSYAHSLEAELVPKAAGGFFRRMLYPFMRIYTKWIYNKSELLLTPSEWVSDHLLWQGIRRSKKVIPLGIDTIAFSKGSTDVRKELGISEDATVIGHVGRLAREKDLRTLLRGFLRMQKKHKDVVLLVVASGLYSVKRMLKRKGVIVLSSKDNIVDYYRAMDIFTMSSLTETTCLAALEAMSCELPVVSTPVGFVKEYVVNGKNGFLYPLRNPFALSMHLQWLVKHREQARKMGKEGRALVRREFSKGAMCRKIVDVLIKKADS